jgi:hypothetical protein
MYGYYSTTVCNLIFIRCESIENSNQFKWIWPLGMCLNVIVLNRGNVLSRCTDRPGARSRKMFSKGIENPHGRFCSSLQIRLLLIVVVRIRVTRPSRITSMSRLMLLPSLRTRNQWRRYGSWPRDVRFYYVYTIVFTFNTCYVLLLGARKCTNCTRFWRRQRNNACDKGRSDAEKKTRSWRQYTPQMLSRRVTHMLLLLRYTVCVSQGSGTRLPPTSDSVVAVGRSRNSLFSRDLSTWRVHEWHRTNK